MFSFFQRLDKGEKRTLLTCFYAFFCSGILSLTMGSVMPDLKAAYHLSDATSGLLLSAHSAGNLIAGFVSGMVPLWLGQRRSIMLLRAMAFLGYFMLTLFGLPAWLMLAFLLIGFGRGSVTNFDNRMVNQLSGGSPAAANLLHGSFAVGAIIAPLVFLGLRNAISWQAGLGFVIGCGFVCVFAFSRMRLKQDSLDRHDKGNTTWVFLKNPSFLILCGMMFCYLCSEYAINGWLVTYFKDRGIIAGTLAAYTVTVMWGATLVGRLLIAFVFPLKKPRKAMVGMSVLCTVFYVLLVMAHTQGAAIALLFAFAISMSGLNPTAVASAGRMTSVTSMGIMLPVASSGAILMPWVIGMVAERAGLAAGMASNIVPCVGLVAFTILVARLPEE